MKDDMHTALARSTALCNDVYMNDERSASSVVERFGRNLRKHREALGWSQSELARKMQDAGWPKYSQVAVSRTEEGTRAVRLDEAFALAAVVGKQVSDLFRSPVEVNGELLLRSALLEVQHAHNQTKQGALDLMFALDRLSDALATEEVQASEHLRRDIQVAEQLLDDAVVESIREARQAYELERFGEVTEGRYGYRGQASDEEVRDAVLGGQDGKHKTAP